MELRFTFILFKGGQFMKIVEKTKDFVKNHKAEIILGSASIIAAMVGCKISYKKGAIASEDYTLSALGVDPYKKIYRCSTKVAATEILDKATFLDDEAKDFIQKHKDKMFDVKFLFN